jgi:hypothetical protein
LGGEDISRLEESLLGVKIKLVEPALEIWVILGIIRKALGSIDDTVEGLAVGETFEESAKLGSGEVEGRIVGEVGASVLTSLRSVASMREVLFERVDEPSDRFLIVGMLLAFDNDLLEAVNELLTALLRELIAKEALSLLVLLRGAIFVFLRDLIPHTPHAVHESGLGSLLLFVGLRGVDASLDLLTLADSLLSHFLSDTPCIGGDLTDRLSLPITSGNVGGVGERAGCVRVMDDGANFGRRNGTGGTRGFAMTFKGGGGRSIVDLAHLIFSWASLLGDVNGTPCEEVATDERDVREKLASLTIG